jgi:hypothetical protein
MTLVHRIAGADPPPPVAAMTRRLPGLDRLSLATLLERLDPLLYRSATRQGWLVVFNPGRIAASSVLTLLALGASPAEADARATTVIEQCHHAP